MSGDYANEHEHDLDAEYLYPSDADVLAIRSGNEGLVVEFVLPCPECNEALRLTGSVTDVVDADLDLPLDDDLYD